MRCCVHEYLLKPFSHFSYMYNLKVKLFSWCSKSERIINKKKSFVVSCAIFSCIVPQKLLHRPLKFNILQGTSLKWKQKIVLSVPRQQVHARKCYLMCATVLPSRPCVAPVIQDECGGRNGRTHSPRQDLSSPTHNVTAATLAETHPAVHTWSLTPWRTISTRQFPQRRTPQVSKTTPALGPFLPHNTCIIDRNSYQSKLFYCQLTSTLTYRLPKEREKKKAQASCS